MSTLKLTPTEMAVARLRQSAMSLRDQAKVLDKQASELEATLPKRKRPKQPVGFDDLFTGRKGK